MRICYVADGASIHTQRWVNYFAQRGHEVHLICWKTIRGYEDGVRFHWLRTFAPGLWPVSRVLNFILWIPRVRKLIREIKPDVVDGLYSTVYGFLAASSGFHPLVVTAVGSDILVQSHNPFWRLFARFGLNRADLVVCRSTAISSEISRLGVRENKVRVIIMGVDTSLFKPGQGSRSPAGAPLIISTRGLSPVYDVETLIRATPEVLRQFPKAKFIIVGDGGEKSSLQNLARDLQANHAVQFVGQVPHHEVPRLLSSADIYVSTSLSDGTSNSLLEGMASGLAPVVTDIPANRLWVKDGENGYLFPVKDARALAARLTHLLENEERRETFGTASREIAMTKAEQKAEMQKLESAYEEMTAKKGE